MNFDEQSRKFTGGILAICRTIEEVLVEDAIELIQNEVNVDQIQMMVAWKLIHESRQKDLKSLISTSE